MSKSRKDSKGRVLRKGESQRKNDGRYIYQYTDPNGKRHVIYAMIYWSYVKRRKTLFATS